MKLQLDTTVTFHKVLERFDDTIFKLYQEEKVKASSVHASTFTRKEFAFSLISDCCMLQAHLYSKRSFVEAAKWIAKIGWHRPRFALRMHEMLFYFIVDRYGHEVKSYDFATKDKILAGHLFDYLRMIIPELWERFDKDLESSLDDRTKCPFGRSGPVEHSGIFKLKRKTTRHPCNGSEGCALEKMLGGKDGKKRGSTLLQELKKIPDKDPSKSKELKLIESFLENFYEKRQQEVCYRMCNSGIGDVIIALETLPERTLVTTNAKEFSVICKSMKQRLKVLMPPTEQ